jgi:hypothetical protein
VPTPLPAAPRPKALALLFLLAAFLVGGGVGYAVGTMTPPQPVPPAAPSERGMREELARELGLSPAQRARFDTVFDWRRARSRELMRDVRPSLDAVRDSARVLLMASLDSTQQAALRRLIDRNQRAADSAARARGEPR